MKAALLARLKRLEEVKANENPPPVEFQIGYLKSLPTEYTGDRHIVTVGRDPDGNYRWEEQYGPEPDDKRSSIPPFRVVLTSPEEDPAPAAQPR
jgi:hypothetical protein